MRRRRNYHNIREGSLIYRGVHFGKNFQTGHFVLIRDPCIIGHNVLVGTGTIIEGHVTIGNNTRIQSAVYIPKYVDIGDNVFIGPCVCITNDKYPPGKMDKTTIGNNVTIGANSTLLPGITIGSCAVIAAGSIVTKDVPMCKMAIGCPAEIVELPESYTNRIVEL